MKKPLVLTVSELYREGGNSTDEKETKYREKEQEN